MKVVRRSRNKLWIFVGGQAFVLRLDKELNLVPRWRIASALCFSSFASAAAFATGKTWGVVSGAVMFLLALFLTWALSR